ncbi:hypothetical protein LTR84_006053 [Exophiala bonariae]|uniref:Mitochondrial zinc maintenance protein 1, mitochondrial n=1 Tax=Exophiala bonariae TaxID=1690606 RepID=A0AAV9N4W1_9EURO|nr:hypothetical protein LTR84_006053 [Exophiala bonariae]
MTQTNPIHLYRSLLREASYLPLAPCRKYIHGFIKQSFHRHHHAPKNDGQQRRYPTLNAVLPATHKFSNGKILTLQKQTALLYRGRQFNSLLVRANQGDMKCFEKILRMTYGRIGRRRYELLHSFNSPILLPLGRNPPPEYCAPEPREAKRSPHWKPPNQMEALIASQAREQDLMPRNKSPKVKQLLSSNVPETNIWGKPLSARRKTNKLHKWYLQNTRAVLPPLPAKEYAELLAMVTGEVPFPEIPTRRPLGTTTTSPRTKRAFPNEIELDPAMRTTSQLLITGPQWRSSSGIPCPSTTASTGRGSTSGFGGHPNARARFTRRYMKRRLSRAVLVQTPLAHAAEKAERGITFSWTDGRAHDKIYKAAVPTLKEGSRQTDLLFG